MGKRRHTLKIGITRSGKTYKALHDIKASSVPTLFYNIKHQEVLKGFKDITSSDTLRKLDHALKHYKMVNYLPSDDEEQREIGIKNIVNYLFKSNFKEVDFVLDEAWEVVPQGKAKSPVFTITRRGLEKIRAEFIVQSPADLDKKAVKQCEIIEVFRLNDWDYKYLKGIGLPAEEIQRKLSNAPQYSFVRVAEGAVSEPMKM